MRDLIDRAAAIDMANDMYQGLSIVQASYSDIGRALVKFLNLVPSAQPEIVMCKDCRWGREVCGNIECFVDANVPPEYHGYEWFCPNGERRTDE